MNSFIEFFYGIKVHNMIYENKYYSFIYQDFCYRLYSCDENVNSTYIYNLNNALINKTLVSEVVVNKNNEIITKYNGNSYLLIKLFVNPNKSISLNEIVNLSESMHKDNININWGEMWGKKIDFLEDLINENGKKYPLLVDSFNYFVGMTENAISYYNSINLDRNLGFVISHKTIKSNDKVEALYNPLNIILDYRVRDIAEYIKNSFFNNNYKIFNELNFYLQYSKLSLSEIELLVSRLLYPSFYFDLYENIFVDNEDEKIILNVVNKLDDYENYLFTIIDFIKRNYNIENIDWLKKRRA